MSQQYQTLSNLITYSTMFEGSIPTATSVKNTYHLELDLSTDRPPFDAGHGGSEDTPSTGHTSQRRTTALQTGN